MCSDVTPELPSPTTYSDKWLVGVKVKIKTTLGEEIDGEIYCVDNMANCLVLQENIANTTKSNYRIIKTSIIKDVQCLAPASEEVLQSIDFPLYYVNLERVKQREEAAIRAAMQEASRVNMGVSNDAQELFNALGKTLPCRWEGETMVIFDTVRISPPYDSDSCRASSGNSSSLAHVLKVLDGERKRLGLHSKK